MSRLKAKLFDEIGASGVRELAEETHIGYRVVAERLRADLKRAREHLESDKDPTETAKLRGEIKGLLTALDMPRDLLGEFHKSHAD